jgi:predicted SnoaL-like aldol condensation-catalyzing enzyme
MWPATRKAQPCTSPEQNKALVLEAFDAPFNKRDYAAAECVWSKRYIQHSAHIPPGRDGLFNLVRALATHSATKITPSSRACQATVVPRHGLPPMSCVFEDGKLGEHWEVLQDEGGIP